MFIMENVMSTAFKFVFESAGGGSTPEYVAAQTGDITVIALTMLFAILAIASILFFAKQRRNNSNCNASSSVDFNTQSGTNHAAEMKSSLGAKGAVAILLAVFSVVGICLTVANAGFVKAFAANALNADAYKTEIVATVHEDTQSISFDTNYFTNVDQSGKPIHIDSSTLSLSPEAEKILEGHDFYFDAQYEDGETKVYDSTKDTGEFLPKDQDALPTGETQNIIYKTNLTYDVAKQLCEIPQDKAAFTLELKPAECYSVFYYKGDAESGECPHSQTITSKGQGEQEVIEAATNEGNLVKTGMDFYGWKDADGTIYQPGDYVSSAAEENITLTAFFVNKSYSVTASCDPSKAGHLEDAQGHKYSKGFSIEAKYGTEYNIDSNGTLSIVDKDGILQSAKPVPELAAQFKFTKWTVNGTEVTEGGTIEGVTSFVANFEVVTYQVSAESNDTKMGTVTLNPSEINAPYGSKYSYDEDTEVMSIVDPADNNKVYGTITPQATDEDKYEFKRWELDSKEVTSGTITSATNFIAVFGDKTYDINFDVESGDGTITQNKLTGLVYGTSITLDETTPNELTFSDGNATYKATAVPNTQNGYMFSEWKWYDESGESITKPDTVTSDLTVKATFNLIPITITFAHSDYGKVLNVADSQEITEFQCHYGDTYEVSTDEQTKSFINFKNGAGDLIKSVKPVPNTNYEFDNWSVAVQDSKYVNGGTEITLPITFTPNFVHKKTEVSFTQDGEGTISVTKLTLPLGTPIKVDSDNKNVIYFGKEKKQDNTVTATPDDDKGYEFFKWVIVKGSEESEITEGSKVESGISLKAYFVKKKYNLSFEADETGKVSTDSLENIEHGTLVSINEATATISFGDKSVTCTPNDNYNFDKWVIVEGSNVKDVISGTEVTGETTFRALTKAQSFKQEFTCEEQYGSVAPTSLEIDYNSPVIVTADKKLQFGAVSDASKTVTATPIDANIYQFVKWQVNTGSGWNDVQSGQKVLGAAKYKAVFEDKKFTVSFEADDNGTVSRSFISDIMVGASININNDNNAVYFGSPYTEDNSVVPTPNTGYEFKEWQYFDGSEWKVLVKWTYFDYNYTKFKAVFVKEKYTLNFEPNDSSLGEVSAHTLTDIEYETPISVSGNTLKIGETNEIKATTLDEGITFTGWVYVKSDGTTETTEQVPSKVSGNMKFRANFSQNRYTVTFKVDNTSEEASNGYIQKYSEDTQPQITVDIYHGTEYEISEDGVFTFKGWKPKDETEDLFIRPVANEHYEFDKWDATEKSGTITESTNFTVSFKESMAKLVFKVVNDEDPHGGFTYAGSTDLLINETQEIRQVHGTVTPVTAVETSKSEDKYQYSFVNWTKDDEVVCTEEEFTPQQTGGFWCDATYVVHFATPRAIYSENMDTGEKLLNFTYDEEPHNEAYQSNNGKNNTYKFVVNNSKFDISAEDPESSIVVPSWYYPAKWGPKGLVEAPSPKIFPTTINIDPSFKNYKGLTSTDMWFMDAAAIYAVKNIDNPEDFSKAIKEIMLYGDTFATRAINSIIGLENINTENLESSSLMFANGKALASTIALDNAGPSIGLPEIEDGITDIDLSSWNINKNKFTGNTIAMFAGCNSLTNLKLPDNFAVNSENMSGMFTGCTQLKSFNAKSNFGENFLYGDAMFYYCTSLEKFDLNKNSSQNGTSTFGQNAKSIKFMFSNCYSLVSVDLSSLSRPDLYEDLFWDDSMLLQLNVPSSWTGISREELSLYTEDGIWWKKESTGEYERKAESAIFADGGGTFTKWCSKAVYYKDKSDFVFYYDYLLHEDGETFYINQGSNNKRQTNFSDVFPSWYDASMYVDGQALTGTQFLTLFGENNDSLKGRDVRADIKLKAPAKNVIFDDSFKDAFKNGNNLDVIAYWFIADSYGNNNCFENFYSYDYDNPQAELTPGFANFDVSNVSSFMNVFGGFSMEMLELLLTDGNINYENSDIDFSASDTYNIGRKELDISTLNLWETWDAQFVGLFANCSNTEKITLPTGKEQTMSPVLLAGMFMNCTKLKDIPHLTDTQVETPTQIFDTSQCQMTTKMFYGCSSLENLNLSWFDTSNMNTAANEYPQLCYGMFSGCSGLQRFNISQKWNLSMDKCGLPYDSNNNWYRNNSTEESFVPSNIPSWNKTDDISKIDYFFKKAKQAEKEITIKSADPDCGKISVDGSSELQESTTIKIYGDTSYYVIDDILYIDGHQITPKASDNYRTRNWQLNNNKIAESKFMSEKYYVSYASDSNVFEVSFISSNLKPYAIYNPDTSRLTFYYDNLDHKDEGQYFEVAKNTHFNLDANTGLYGYKFPSWYQADVTGDAKLESCTLKVNTKLLVNAKDVVFSNSFSDFDELQSISMWFMADSSGNQCFENFYSEDKNGKLLGADQSFVNLNTTNLTNVKFAFGGFSTLPFIADSYSDVLRKKFISDMEDQDGFYSTVDGIMAAYVNPVLARTDTYGNSIKNLDLTSFDTEHNLKDYSALLCNCQALQQVKFNPDIYQATITNLNATFQNCETFGLDSTINPIVNLDKFNTKSVKNINLTFFGDFRIKSLDLSSFDLSGVWPASSINDPEHLDCWLTFYDCTRLSEVKVTCESGRAMNDVKGWVIPFGAGSIPVTYDILGDKHTWTNDAYQKETWDNEMTFPCDRGGKLQSYNGTFKRDASLEYTTNFSAGTEGKGKINGETDIDYKYISNNTVRLDPNDPASLICDNYKVTASPSDISYRFSHWEYFGPEDKTGNYVTGDRTYYFDAAERSYNRFVAIFDDGTKTAKAVYKKSETFNADKEATLTFVYDNESHDNADYVFDVKSNASMTNLPDWYEDAGLPNWVDGENRPMRKFAEQIDTGNENTRPGLIKIDFDSSFADFKDLQSLSGWFNPGISRADDNKLYCPFKFDSENFSGLHNIDTANIYNVEYMFGGHENSNMISGAHIDEINLTNFDKANNLKNINAMFAGCLDLDDLTLHPEFGKNCVSMSKTFMNCKKIGDNTDEESGITKLVKNLNISNVADMSYMFAQYKIPTSDDGSSLNAEENSTELIFPGTFHIERTLSNIEGMFAGFTDTQELTITGGGGGRLELNNATNLFANITNCSSALKKVNIDGRSWLTLDGVTSLAGMFKNCNSIDSLSFIGATSEGISIPRGCIDMSYMFSGCTSLKNANFGENFDSSRVVKMDHMFENTGFVKVDFSESGTLSNLSTNSLVTCSYMFSGCKNLIEVNLARYSAEESGVDYSVIQDARFMFADSPNINKVSLSRFNISSYIAKKAQPQYYAGSNMFSIHDGSYIYDNYNIVNVVVSQSWSSDENSLHPLDCIGIPNIDLNYGTETKWYIKELVSGGANTLSYLSQLMTTADGLEITLTLNKPKQINVKVNNEFWGEVQSSLESSSDAIEFFDSLQFTYYEDSSQPDLQTYIFNPNPLIDRPMYVSCSPIRGSESVFDHWEYQKEGQEEPVQVETGQNITFTDNATLTAVFRDGVAPYAVITQESSEEPNEALRLICATEDMLKDKIPEGDYQMIPPNGDWSEVEDGRFYATEENKGRYSKVMISEQMAEYTGFTTFADWFKDLDNLQGDAFTDTSPEGDYSMNTLGFLNFSNVTCIDSMFEGCSNLTKLDMTSHYQKIEPGKKSKAISANNAFSGCSNLQFAGLFTETNYSGDTKDTFNECSNLEAITFVNKPSMDLTKLGLKSEKQWLISSQKSLNTWSIGNVYSKIPLRSDSVINCICAVDENDKATVKGSDDFVSFSGDGQSSVYIKDYPIYFNEAINLSCQVFSNQDTLGVRYVLSNDRNEDVCWWEHNIYKKYNGENNFVFYYWEQDGRPLPDYNEDPLKKDDVITAKYDEPKDIYGVLGEDGTLTFKYEKMEDEPEGATIVVAPNQWSSSCSYESPFNEVKDETKKVVFDENFKDCWTLYDTYYWFADFSNLETADLNNLTINGSNPNLSYMFMNCENLKSVNLGGISISNDYYQTDTMFGYCSSLSSITFGEGWTSDASYYNLTGNTIDSSDIWLSEDGKNVTPTEFPNNNTGMTGNFEKATDFIHLSPDYGKGDISYSGQRIGFIKDTREVTCKYDSGSKSLQIMTKKKDGTDGEIIDIFTFANEGWVVNPNAPWVIWDSEKTTETEIKPDGTEYTLSADDGLSPKFENDDRRLYAKFTEEYEEQGGQKYGNVTLTYEHIENPGNQGYRHIESNSADIWNSPIAWALDVQPECVTGVTIDPSVENVSFVKSYCAWFKNFSSVKTFDTNQLKFLRNSAPVNTSCMFQGCSSVTNLNVAYLNMSKVINMGCMFSDMSSLESLEFRADGYSFDPIYASSFEECFKNCNSLKTLDLSTFSLCSKDGLNFSNAFYHLNSLQSIDLSFKIRTTYFDYTDNLLRSCPSLHEIKINQWSVGLGTYGLNGTWRSPSKQTFNGMWWYNFDEEGTYERRVDISFAVNNKYAGSLENADTISYFSSDNESATYSIVNGNVKIVKINSKGEKETTTVKPVSIAPEQYTFNNWDISPNPGTDAKITLSTTFTANFDDSYKARAYYNDSTKTLTLYYDDADHGTLPYVEVPRDWCIGKFYNTSTHIKELSPFSEFKDAELVKIDWSFANFKGITSLYNWFYDFEKVEKYDGLENLDLSDLRDEATEEESNYLEWGRETGLTGMFKNNKSLKELDLYKLNTLAAESPIWNVTEICCNCESLETVELYNINSSGKRESNFDLSNAGRIIGAFKNCKKIKSLDFSYLSDSILSYRNREWADWYYNSSLFDGCFSLESVNLGSVVLGDSWQEYQFRGCYSLTDIYFYNPQVRYYVNDPNLYGFESMNLPGGNWQYSTNKTDWQDCTMREGWIQTGYYKRVSNSANVNFAISGDSAPKAGVFFAYVNVYSYDTYVTLLTNITSDTLKLPEGSTLEPVVESEPFTDTYVIYFTDNWGYKWYLDSFKLHNFDDASVVCKWDNKNIIIHSGDNMISGTAMPVSSNQLANSSALSSSDAAIDAPKEEKESEGQTTDPVDPVVDPSQPNTPEELTGFQNVDENAPDLVAGVSAMLSAFPALALLGFRKRIRGKHTKL